MQRPYQEISSPELKLFKIRESITLKKKRSTQKERQKKSTDKLALSNRLEASGKLTLTAELKATICILIEEESDLL